MHFKNPLNWEGTNTKITQNRLLFLRTHTRKLCISNSDLLVSKSSKSLTDDPNPSTLMISNSNLITSVNSLNCEATTLNTTCQKLNTESSDSNIDKANVLFVSNLHPSATLDDLKGLSKRIQNAFFEENQGLR